MNIRQSMLREKKEKSRKDELIRHLANDSPNILTTLKQAAQQSNFTMFNLLITPMLHVDFLSPEEIRILLAGMHSLGIEDVLRRKKQVALNGEASFALDGFQMLIETLTAETGNHPVRQHSSETNNASPRSHSVEMDSSSSLSESDGSEAEPSSSLSEAENIDDIPRIKRSPRVISHLFSLGKDEKCRPLLPPSPVEKHSPIHRTLPENQSPINRTLQEYRRFRGF